ncbi:DUF58 domain-containing protein [Natrialba sp. PRR66]|uniref:DUF58 domain-containing protein n=1 Tax=Natrialba sp. PRR66 TaxID=3098146 RepID=UPI002B1E717E|nr:DUF58 domain-containing protein [Natrialba sp. PRR66]
MTARRTTRWNSALIAALLASGIGALVADPTLLLLSIPPVVFAVYSHVPTSPAATLELERSCTEPAPSHGQAVEVTVTLKNAGDRVLPSVCLVDGVPPMLSVTDGSARHAAALGPDDETTFSYTVTAKHGTHRFRPAAVVLEDISGSVAVETNVETETELACRSPVRTAMLEQVAHRYAGSTITVDNGHGTVFSTVRSYQPGDPQRTIDWNRYARDRELTTISFRDERSRATLLCLDAREVCYRSDSSDEPHAVFYACTVARELLDTIATANGPVGLAVFGTEQRYIAPNTGAHHVETIRQTLDDPKLLPLEPPNRTRPGDTDELPIRPLRTRFGEASILLISPLLDDSPLETARTLRADGQPVTVISPAVTATRSLGTAVAGLRRDNRLGALRRSNVTVIDWDPETALETAIRAGANR